VSEMSLSESVIRKTSKEIPVTTLPRGLINVSGAARICHPDGVRFFFPSWRAQLPRVPRPGRVG